MSDDCCSTHGPGAPGGAQPTPAAAPHTQPLDAMTATVLDRVRDLADGNRVVRNEVQVTGGHATDYRLDVRMTATGYSRVHHAETCADHQHPAHGRRVGGRGQLKAAGREAYEAFRQRQDFDGKVRALVERDPAMALRQGAREVPLYANIQTLYVHDRHMACNGQGWTWCTVCHDGKRPCPGCNGSGRVQVQRQGINGGIEYVTEACHWNCLYGRWGSCPNCTDRRVPCHGCAQTGRITDIYTTEAGVDLEVHARPQSDAPAAFRRYFQRLPNRALSQDAEVSFQRTEGGSGTWTFRFDAKAPYARTELKAGEIARFSIEAAGKRVSFVDPPAFLDMLIDPVRRRIVKAPGPQACFSAARETRLTRDLLTMCADRASNDPEGFVRARRACVSPELVAEVSAAVDRHYDRAGVAVVTRTWAAILPVIAIAGLATLFTGWIQALTGTPRDLTHGEIALIAALLLVAAGWVAGFRVAARRGHAAVRKLLGKQAGRPPRQPAGVALWLPLLLLLLIGGIGNKLYAGPDALTDTREPGLAGKLDHLAGGDVGALLDATLPSNTRTADGRAPIDPPTRDIVNNQRVYVLQYRLAQLGHYTGSLDGLDGPMTRRAIARFHAAHPDLRATGDLRTVARQAATVMRRSR